MGWVKAIFLVIVFDIHIDFTHFLFVSSPAGNAIKKFFLGFFFLAQSGLNYIFLTVTKKLFILWTKTFLEHCISI